MLYGPVTVETNVGNNNLPVKITEETNYPFEDKIKFNFQSQEPVNFDFFSAGRTPGIICSK